MIRDFIIFLMVACNSVSTLKSFEDGPQTTTQIIFTQSVESKRPRMNPATVVSSNSAVSLACLSSR